MTEKQRLLTAMDRKQPDKVPHFELVFQLPTEAFGMPWPTGEMMSCATPKERELLREQHFEIIERIIERYHWSAIAQSTSLGGFYADVMIPEAKRRFGDRALIYDWNGDGTFWLMGGQDMMEFSVMLFERPDEVHAQARVKCEAAKRLAKKQVDQGVDFICLNSDFGYNQGPFISPAMFAEFITPYLCEVVDTIHGLGVKAMLHSDGDLNKILDQLVGAGLDGFQSIDPQGRMDLSAVKRDYGDRLFLMGNVQASLLQDSSENVIRADVRRALSQGKPGGGFILSTSNCIFDGMPLNNYHIMLDEYEKNAMY